MNKLKENIQILNNEIWQLTADFNPKLNQMIDNLRQGFKLKTDALKDVLNFKESSLEQIRIHINDKKDYYRRKNSGYCQYIASERARMQKACGTAGCSCYGNDTEGEVALSYNSMEGCIGTLDGRTSAYYGCRYESSVYRTHYAQYTNGYSPDDVSALQRSTTRTRLLLNVKTIAKP